MLSPDLVPTPLLCHSEKKSVEFAEPVKPRFRTLSILISVFIWVFDMAVLWVTFNWTSKSKGIVSKKMIERLGFLWIKLGQIMSLRKDLLGKDFCDELTSLQSNVPFFPFKYVKSQIYQDLGVNLEDIFSSFDKKPLAAASIAQVHRARLKVDGSDVVVKIMRPYAKDVFIKDLKFLRYVVSLLKKLNLWSHMRWDEAIWEIQHMMMEETDYQFEMSNLKRYKKSLKRHKIYVPSVFSDYCSKHVLVLEYVPGVLLSEYNDLHKTDPERVDGWCEDNNFKPKKAGLKLLLSFSRQIFEDNLYHADLHPGNIMLLKDSKMVLIDIGSVGTVEADLQRRFFSTIKSLAIKDYYKVADLMISYCPVVPMIDLSDLTEELVRCLRDWELKTPVKTIDYYEKSVTLVILEMVELMTVRYKLSIGWGFLKITRSWCNLESSLNCMMPRSNNLKAFSVYFSKRDQRVIKYLSQPEAIRSNIVSGPDTMNEYRLFIEPRIRRASRVVQLGLKRSDHIIMGISRILSLLLAYGFYFSLILVAILYAQHNTWVNGIFYSCFPDVLMDYLHMLGNKYIAAVEKLFSISLSNEHRWWWSFLPAMMAFTLWRRIKGFRGNVGDSDVQIDGFLNR